LESGARYTIFLARFFTPPGSPKWDGLANQNVWLLVGRDLAENPNTSIIRRRSTKKLVPSCELGSGFIIENANTGKGLAAASD